MKLSDIEVEHIARLARLTLSPGEKKQYAEELSAILSYVERLQKISVAGVEPTIHVTAELAACRPDVVVACDETTRVALVDAFPKAKNDLLAVPPVFADYKE